MPRDIRTRFGAPLWDYAIVVLWPCVHMGFLNAIYTSQKLPAPTDGLAPILFASGALPVLIFQYTSRKVMKPLSIDRSSTYCSEVKLSDLVFPRALVEIVTGFFGLIVVFSVLSVLGYDPRPAQPFVAVCGYCTAILLGIGNGTINVAVVSFLPVWFIGYVLFTIIMYIFSGMMFMANYMSDKLYYWVN